MTRTLWRGNPVSQSPRSAVFALWRENDRAPPSSDDDKNHHGRPHRLIDGVYKDLEIHALHHNSKDEYGDRSDGTASVGVNRPAMSPPMTITKMTTTEMNSGGFVSSPSREGLRARRPQFGIDLAPDVYDAMKRTAIIIPGIIPARNNLPIDCSVMIP